MITCIAFAVVCLPFFVSLPLRSLNSSPISYLFAAFAPVLFRFPKRGFSVGFAVESVFVTVFGLPVEWMLLCFCGLDRRMDNWDECIIDFIRKFAG